MVKLQIKQDKPRLLKLCDQKEEMELFENKIRNQMFSMEFAVRSLALMANYEQMAYEDTISTAKRAWDKPIIEDFVKEAEHRSSLDLGTKINIKKVRMTRSMLYVYNQKDKQIKIVSKNYDSGIK